MDKQFNKERLKAVIKSKIFSKFDQNFQQAILKTFHLDLSDLDESFFLKEKEVVEEVKEPEISVIDNNNTQESTESLPVQEHTNTMAEQIVEAKEDTCSDIDFDVDVKEETSSMLEPVVEVQTETVEIDEAATEPLLESETIEVVDECSDDMEITFETVEIVEGEEQSLNNCFDEVENIEESNEEPIEVQTESATEETQPVIEEVVVEENVQEVVSEPVEDITISTEEEVVSSTAEQVEESIQEESVNTNTTLEDDDPFASFDFSLLDIDHSDIESLTEEVDAVTTNSMEEDVVECEEIEVDEEEQVVYECPDFSDREQGNAPAVYDNFQFLMKIEPNIYKHLKETEKLLIEDTDNAATRLSRGAYDTLLNKLIIDNKWEPTLKDLFINPKNYTKSRVNERYKSVENTKIAWKFVLLKYFVSINEFKNKKGEIYNSEAFKPFVEQLKNKCEIFKNEDSDLLEFIDSLVRSAGNAGAHLSARDFTKSKKNLEKMRLRTIEEMQIGLEALHQLLRWYYCGKIGSKYQRDYSKIDDYDIYSTKSIKGKQYLKEYYGYSEKYKKYAIIRSYKNEDLKEDFITRAIDALGLVSRQSYDRITGLPEIRALNTLKSEKEHEFFYLGYIFGKKPEQLNKKVLDKIQTDYEKIHMCYVISGVMNTLHHLPYPIYHRMLNPEAIMVCDYAGQDGYVPYVVGFDFSKIEKSDEYATVRNFATERYKQYKKDNPMLASYLCINDTQEGINFAKVDVYAMGVLFGHILYGQLMDKKVDLDLLEGNYSEEIIDLLDRMTSMEAASRPDSSEVYEVFSKEFNKWRK